MYQVQIIMTGKGYGSSRSYCILGDESHSFATLADAKAFLKARYGTCKRRPMYRDRPDGSSYQTGFVACFHNSDWSHAPVNRWLQQDWCEIREVTPVDLSSAA